MIIAARIEDQQQSYIAGHSCRHRSFSGSPLSVASRSWCRVSRDGDVNDNNVADDDDDNNDEEDDDSAVVVAT